MNLPPKVETSPVEVNIRFSTKGHLRQAVNALTYYLQLPLPPEVCESEIHKKYAYTLEVLQRTYGECLEAADPEFHFGTGTVETDPADA